MIKKDNFREFRENVHDFWETFSVLTLTPLIIFDVLTVYTCILPKDCT